MYFLYKFLGGIKNERINRSRFFRNIMIDKEIGVRVMSKRKIVDILKEDYSVDFSNSGVLFIEGHAKSLKSRIAHDILISLDSIRNFGSISNNNDLDVLEEVLKMSIGKEIKVVQVDVSGYKGLTMNKLESIEFIYEFLHRLSREYNTFIICERSTGIETQNKIANSYKVSKEPNICCIVLERNQSTEYNIKMTIKENRENPEKPIKLSHMIL